MPASSSNGPRVYPKKYGSPRTRASGGELLFECRVAQLGIKIKNFRPVRHDRLGKLALTVEHLLEERVLRGIAVEHDIRCLDKLRIELFRRVENLHAVFFAQLNDGLRIAIDVEG